MTVKPNGIRGIDHMVTTKFTPAKGTASAHLTCNHGSLKYIMFRVMESEAFKIEESAIIYAINDKKPANKKDAIEAIVDSLLAVAANMINTKGIKASIAAVVVKLDDRAMEAMAEDKEIRIRPGFSALDIRLNDDGILKCLLYKKIMDVKNLDDYLNISVNHQ